MTDLYNVEEAFKDLKAAEVVQFSRYGFIRIHASGRSRPSAQLAKQQFRALGHNYRRGSKSIKCVIPQS
jgi:Mn-dependent DtxR family transcriptional regulator